MIKILKDLISDVCHMFFDDIAVKESQFNYNSKESLLSIYQYILEAIQNLNSVLVNVECVKECISEEKLQYVMKQLQIVKYICKLKRYSLKAVKTLKFVD